MPIFVNPMQQGAHADHTDRCDEADEMIYGRIWPSRPHAISQSVLCGGEQHDFFSYWPYHDPEDETVPRLYTDRDISEADKGAYFQIWPADRRSGR